MIQERFKLFSHVLSFRGRGTRKFLNCFFFSKNLRLYYHTRLRYLSIEKEVFQKSRFDNIIETICIKLFLVRLCVFSHSHPNFPTPAHQLQKLQNREKYYISGIALFLGLTAVCRTNACTSPSRLNTSWYCSPTRSFLRSSDTNIEYRKVASFYQVHKERQPAATSAVSILSSKTPHSNR